MPNYTYRTRPSATIGLRPPPARPNPTRRPDAPTKPLTRCPACGELECLCRPRFFPGQLLTDEDLRRLDNYIVKKKQMHNRYLHGWGVVCGMEVICSPCDGQVTVRSGLALDPCGNDITLCDDDSFDVCKAINMCKEKDRMPNDCEPPRSRDDGCDEAIEQWVIAVRYEEMPTRYKMPLRQDKKEPCCSRCACNGASVCGCQCHEKLAPAPGRRTTVEPSPQCEPTITCEGYAFEVYKAPPPSDPSSAMEREFARCMERFLAFVPDAPPDTANDDELKQWCCRYKDALKQLLNDMPVYDCTLLQKLSGIACPDPLPGQTMPQYLLRVVQTFGAITNEYLRYCICTIFLPPCPEPADDVRVPLATLTFDTRTCRVVKVCNWTNRKFATTWPNMQYWLSPLPCVRMLRDRITTVCCDIDKGADPRPDSLDFDRGKRRSYANFVTGRDLKSSLKSISEIVTRSILDKDRGVNNAYFTYGMLGGLDKKGEPFLSDTELQYPLHFMFANQILAPNIRGNAPGWSLNMLRMMAGGGVAATPEGAGREEIQELASQVDALKTRIAELEGKF